MLVGVRWRFPSTRAQGGKDVWLSGLPKALAWQPLMMCLISPPQTITRSEVRVWRIGPISFTLCNASSGHLAPNNIAGHSAHACYYTCPLPESISEEYASWYAGPLFFSFSNCRHVGAGQSCRMEWLKHGVNLPHFVVFYGRYRIICSGCY